MMLTSLLLALSSAAMLAAALPAPAALNVVDLHNFDSNSGYAPNAGIITDSKGRMFGTTPVGGAEVGPCFNTGCGTVYELAFDKGSWKLTVLYNFQDGGDGYAPNAPVTAGPHGTLFGYTGSGNYGVVWQLTPPSGRTGDWTFQILYSFAGGADGNLLYVASPVVWLNGALYGIASGGSDNCGSPGCGSLYRLTPPRSGKGSWAFRTLYGFTGGSDGGMPGWIAGLKGQHALYVATAKGKGAIVQLTPSGEGNWSASVISTFKGGTDGDAPGNLVVAPDGTIYGTAKTGYTGNVFALSDGSGNWSRTTIARISMKGYGPTSLAFGSNGTLIGAVYGDADYFAGGAFKLTPDGSKWKYSELIEFALDNHPWHQPNNVVVGREGVLYGVVNGSDWNAGSVFELYR